MRSNLLINPRLLLVFLLPACWIVLTPWSPWKIQDPLLWLLIPIFALGGYAIGLRQLFVKRERRAFIVAIAIGLLWFAFTLIPIYQHYVPGFPRHMHNFWGMWHMH